MEKKNNDKTALLNESARHVAKSTIVEEFARNKGAVNYPLFRNRV